jgi:YD repeat-containing protein
VNLIESYRSPLGAEERFTYNKDKQLTRRLYPSGDAIDYVYNTQGQLTEMQTPEGTHTFSYDPSSGFLTKAISRDGQQVDYGYKAYSNGGKRWHALANWTNLVAGPIRYAYNADLRVARINYHGANLRNLFTIR